MSELAENLLDLEKHAPHAQVESMRQFSAERLAKTIGLFAGRAASVWAANLEPEQSANVVVPKGMN